MAARTYFDTSADDLDVLQSATLVGMLVGLSPLQILLAVAIGASAECLLFAVGSDIIWRLILGNISVGIPVAGAVLAAVVVAYVLLRRWYGGEEE